MFQKNLLNMALMAMLTASISVFATKPVTAQGMLQSCANDIVKFCEGVTPGNGHYISCLYAREDQISAQCSDAFDDVGDVLDSLFSTLGYALATCAPDIEKHCVGTKFGQGRLFTCLNEKKADIGTQCKAIITKFADDVAN